MAITYLQQGDTSYNISNDNADIRPAESFSGELTLTVNAGTSGLKINDTLAKKTTFQLDDSTTYSYSVNADNKLEVVNAAGETVVALPLSLDESGNAVSPTISVGGQAGNITVNPETGVIVDGDDIGGEVSDAAMLTAALTELSNAEQAEADFLKGLELDTDLDGTVDVEAGDAAEGDVTEFYNAASGAVGTSVGVANFEAKDASAQDGYISAEQSNLQADVTNAAANVAEGVEALLTTVTAREEQLLAAVKATNAAEKEVDVEFAAFQAANAPTLAGASKGDVEFINEADYDENADNAGSFFVIDGKLYTGADGTGTPKPLAGLAKEDATRADQFKAALDAKANADAAQTSANDALTGVLADVIKAEQDAFDVNEDDIDADGSSVLVVDDTAGGEKVTIDFDKEVEIKATSGDSFTDTVGGAAPNADDLYEALNAQSDFAEEVATFEEARELNNTLDSLQTSVEDAKVAIENAPDAEENPGLGINLVDTTAFDTGDDVYLFDAETSADATLTGFGANGQDNIYFGNDEVFSLVAIEEGQDIATDDLGNSEALEIFWEQDGGNVNLYVEDKAFGGNATGVQNLTKVELSGVDGTEIQNNLDNGLLTLGTSAADIA